MILDSLLERRVVFVSGKGGVGKSVVSAALAWWAAARGQRTLLVEIDAPQTGTRPWGAAAASSSGLQPTQVRPGLFQLNLEPRAVMDEYVRHVLRFDLLASRVLASPIYTRFFSAAPGLKELMTLGKVMVLEEARGRGGRPQWDFIVVDAPATGHGMSLLKVPQAASAAVPVGPVGHNARRVLALLRDERRSGLLIVAVPEEMAVLEAAELQRVAGTEVGLATLGVVLNGCHERQLTPAQERVVLARLAEHPGGWLAPRVELGAALAAARRHIRRRRLTDFHLRRLRRLVPLPLVTLPYLFDETLGLAQLETLAGRLAQA